MCDPLSSGDRDRAINGSAAENGDGKGVVTEKGPVLNDVFLEAIRKKGRVHELSLILDLKRRTGGLFKLDKDEIRLGIEMFRHGKLKLLPSRIKETEAMKKLFSRLEKTK